MIMIRTVLNIDGMACGMCESHINDAIRHAFSVEKVSSSHKKGTTEIISEVPLDEKKIKEVIDATGYTMAGFSSEPYQKKGFSLFHRS